MPNRLFQSLIFQMKDVIDRTIGVMDENNTVISCSDPKLMGSVHDLGDASYNYGTEAFAKGHYTYKPFGIPQHPEYYVFVDGIDRQAAQYCAMLAISLSNVKLYYDERYDKCNFVKNIILDNILPGDIYLKARDLRFNNDVKRTAFLIRTVSGSDVLAYDIIQKLFPEKNKDFVISISETEIALIKETGNDIEAVDLENLAKSIIDTLASEFFVQAIIGIGSTVDGLKDVARSFKEAQVALEVGKVFDNNNHIVSYGKLGIARLIYQLPTTLCDSFMREVFKTGSIESLDQETLFTIQKFFENNLNVSETSRKLFVHRNTLVYRLDKIKKITGLDLREFDHAIVFKIALMVKKYLNSNPMKY